MSIKHAILGFLSRQALSGYDLKRMFEDTDFITWAGSNNQIYGTLLEMQRAGLVTHQVQQPDRGPSRKVYTVTESGLAELDGWLRSEPQPPEFHNAFLMQLAWADRLAPGELDALLERYERQVEVRLLMARERQRRGPAYFPGSFRGAYLLEMIADNAIGHYENELAWVRRMRDEVGGRQSPADVVEP